MNSIKWIHKNYNCITTNCLLDCPFFHSYQEFLSVLIQYCVHIRKLYRKSLCCKYRFVIYHLEECSVPTAVRYKNCAQIFVLRVSKKPIWYTIRDATNSYNLMNGNTSYPKKLMKQKRFKFCCIRCHIYLIQQIWSH